MEICRTHRLELIAVGDAVAIFSSWSLIYLTLSAFWASSSKF